MEEEDLQTCQAEGGGVVFHALLLPSHAQPLASCGQALQAPGHGGEAVENKSAGSNRLSPRRRPAYNTARGGAAVKNAASRRPQWRSIRPAPAG